MTILRRLKYPRIINLHEVYEEREVIHLVFELAYGEELHTFVKAKKILFEIEAGKIMYKLVEALAYCHSNDIIHRDIKPSNIILKFIFIKITNYSKGNPNTLKLIDFGLGIFNNISRGTDPLCGSPGYIAPEIFERNYFDEKSDIYSCGILLYFMLSGDTPFKGSNSKEVLMKNKENIIKFTDPRWQQISAEAKELIIELTQDNPDMRPTTDELLENSWLQKYITADPLEADIDPSIPDSYCLAFAKSFGSKLSVTALNEFMTSDSAKKSAFPKSTSQLRKLTPNPREFKMEKNSGSLADIINGHTKGETESNFLSNKHCVSGVVKVAPKRKSYFASHTKKHEENP